MALALCKKYNPVMRPIYLAIVYLTGPLRLFCNIQTRTSSIHAQGERCEGLLQPQTPKTQGFYMGFLKETCRVHGVSERKSRATTRLGLRSRLLSLALHNELIQYNSLTLVQDDSGEPETCKPSWVQPFLRLATSAVPCLARSTSLCLWQTN